MKLLKTQRRLAATVLRCSPHRISLDPTRLEDIKEAITKVDIAELINEGVITRAPIQGISRGRARALHAQRVLGRRQGPSTRKGTSNARFPKKTIWIRSLRAQRSLLKQLRAKGSISSETFKGLYQKSKGNFFRSRRHIRVYIDEHVLKK